MSKSHMKKWPYFLICAMVLLLVILAIGGVLGGSKKNNADIGSRDLKANDDPQAVLIATELENRFLSQVNEFCYIYTEAYKAEKDALKDTGESSLKIAQFISATQKAHDDSLQKDLRPVLQYLDEFESRFAGHIIPQKAWQDKIKTYCYLAATYSLTYDDDQKVVEMYNSCYPLHKQYSNRDTNEIFQRVFSSYIPEYLSRQITPETTQLIYSETEKQKYEQELFDSLSGIPYIEEQAQEILENLENCEVILTDVKIGYIRDYDSGDLSAIWKFVDEDGNEFILEQLFLAGELNPDTFGSPYIIPTDVLLKIYWKRLRYPDGSEDDIITGYEVMDRSVEEVSG
jgi:hypothetical protein